MKAACVDRYGPPEVVVVQEMPEPVVGEHDVLVRQAASTTPEPMKRPCLRYSP